MAILKIARLGHPVLLRRADPVPDPTAPEIQQLILSMVETMNDAGGIGLAAPQVHIPLRLFVFRLPVAGPEEEVDPAGAGPHVLINPEIEPLETETALGWEGCLSIPGLQAAVPRYRHIRYRGLDAEGKAVERVAEGRHAVVVQHENDHLDGILYTMRMTDFSLMGFTEELARFRPQIPSES